MSTSRMRVARGYLLVWLCVYNAYVSFAVVRPVERIRVCLECAHSLHKGLLAALHKRLQMPRRFPSREPAVLEVLVEEHRH